MPVRGGRGLEGRIRAACPELPFDKQRRFVERVRAALHDHLSPGSRPRAERLLRGGRPAVRPAACGRPTGSPTTSCARWARRGCPLAESRRAPRMSPPLVGSSSPGAILGTAAKEVFAGHVRAPAKRRRRSWTEGLRPGAEPAIWSDGAARRSRPIRGGRRFRRQGKRDQRLQGPVMRAAKGKADPKLVDETLRRLLRE